MAFDSHADLRRCGSEVDVAGEKFPYIFLVASKVLPVPVLFTDLFLAAVFSSPVPACIPAIWRRVSYKTAVKGLVRKFVDCEEIGKPRKNPKGIRQYNAQLCPYHNISPCRAPQR